MATKTLKGLTGISRGAPKGRLEDARDETADVLVVQPVNLSPRGVTGELTKATAAHYKLETYQLHEGDVLVSLLDAPDTPLRVGLVTSEVLRGEALVAGANVAVLRLRPHTQVDPRYLALYLRSQGAARLLRTARGGSAQSYLNVAALGEVGVPVPPLGEQRRAAELHDSYERYALETQRLLAAERNLLEARFDQWVRSAHG